MIYEYLSFKFPGHPGPRYANPRGSIGLGGPRGLEGPKIPSGYDGLGQDFIPPLPQ